VADGIPPPPPPVRRRSGLLVTSILLTSLSILLPGIGPVGPIVAGFLAFVGYRAVRKSGGVLRGPVLASAAMSLALGALVLMGVAMLRDVRPNAALRRVKARVAEVEATLRTGTAEGAFELLAPDAPAAADRTAFLRGLRETMTRLGPLEAMESESHPGGDWKDLGSLDGSRSLRLPVDIDARFRGGKGTIGLEFRVSWRDDAARADLLRLTVARP
jgi:hypothetical protein